MCLSGCSIWHICLLQLYVGLSSACAIYAIKASVTHLFCYFILPCLMKAKWHNRLPPKKQGEGEVCHFCVTNTVTSVCHWSDKYVVLLLPQTQNIGFDKIYILLYLSNTFSNLCCSFLHDLSNIVVN